MFQIDNLKNIKSSFALILTAVIIGFIVSIIAQFFIFSAQEMFSLVYGKSFLNLNYHFFGLNLNLSSLIICLSASLIVCIFAKIIKIDRWHGPADTILAAHHMGGTLDVKKGFYSTITSFISISGGASVGIYGPLVHFGGTLAAFIRRRDFMPNIPHDIIIGSGVAAAISAAFASPFAGIIFAHEVVLRHFSMRAITAIALSSVTANFTASEIGIVSAPLNFEDVSFNLIDALPGLTIIGPVSACVAYLFMKGLFISLSLAKKSQIKIYLTPIFPGLFCGLIGMFYPEVLGLGAETILSVITQPETIVFLIVLLFLKMFLTCFCIGFGLFGGVFSPALFLGTMTGAIIFQLPFFGVDENLLSIFAVSAMACVASSVIGAPITASILILELTGSYKYAIASVFPIAICTFLTYLSFGSSFFDKQLFQRGIVISRGRETLLMNQTIIKSYIQKDFLKFPVDISLKNAVDLFNKNKTTEAYFVKEDSYFGKVRLVDLIDKKNGLAFDYKQKNHVKLYENNSLSESMKSLLNFVGESVPVLSKSKNKILGVVSENDVLKGFLEVREKIFRVEKG